jgi:hypothetical protein
MGRRRPCRCCATVPRDMSIRQRIRREVEAKYYVVTVSLYMVFAIESAMATSESVRASMDSISGITGHVRHELSFASIISSSPSGLASHLIISCPGT